MRVDYEAAGRAAGAWAQRRRDVFDLIRAHTDAAEEAALARIAALGWSQVRLEEVDIGTRRVRAVVTCLRCPEVQVIADEWGRFHPVALPWPAHRCPVLAAERDARAYWGDLLETGPGMVA